MMIRTRLRPLTTPETVPTVCISPAGSFDFGAVVIMKKKKPTAMRTRTTPTITIRQFLRRIGSSSYRKHECRDNVRVYCQRQSNLQAATAPGSDRLGAGRGSPQIRGSRLQWPPGEPRGLRRAIRPAELVDERRVVRGGDCRPGTTPHRKVCGGSK